jgi:hypothetical protein
MPAPFLSRGKSVREIHRRDGCVKIYDEIDDKDELVVEPKILSFNPVRDHLFCACGAKLGPWSLRQTADGAELICHHCHHNGRLTLGVRVHR